VSSRHEDGETARIRIRIRSASLFSPLPDEPQELRFRTARCGGGGAASNAHEVEGTVAWRSCLAGAWTAPRHGRRPCRGVLGRNENRTGRDDPFSSASDNAALDSAHFSRNVSRHPSSARKALTRPARRGVRLDPRGTDRGDVTRRSAAPAQSVVRLAGFPRRTGSGSMRRSVVCSTTLGTTDGGASSRGISPVAVPGSR